MQHNSQNIRPFPISDARTGADELGRECMPQMFRRSCKSIALQPQHRTATQVNSGGHADVENVRTQTDCGVGWVRRVEACMTRRSGNRSNRGSGPHCLRFASFGHLEGFACKLKEPRKLGSEQIQ